MPTMTLGRNVVHDDRSLAHPADTAPSTGPVFWPHHGTILNQHQTSSCTAQALTACLFTGPFYRTGTKRPAHLADSETAALHLYSVEVGLEGGTFPPDDPGGSGLEVSKAAQDLGWISGYTHAFGLDHAHGAIGLSPVIIGIPWYQDMFTPDADGFVTIGGDLAGGHEVAVVGYDPARGWACLNSWGVWGCAVPESRISHGGFWMTDATFGQLLGESGDVTVPVL